MTPLQTLLLLLGAALELAGIGLAVMESLDVRRAFRTRHLRAHFRGVADFTATLDAVKGTGGDPPSIEQRVELLERRVERLPKEIEERITATRDALRDEIRNEAASIRGNIAFHVEDLRRLLGVGVEPNRRRTVGFLLFAVGLILQTAAQWRL